MLECDKAYARCLDNNFDDSREPELLRGKRNDAEGKDLVAKSTDWMRMLTVSIIVDGRFEIERGPSSTRERNG